MKTALLVTYFFPPLSGGGVQRSAKFTKYLPDFDWRPLVLTVRPNSRNETEQGLDKSLLAEIPKAVEITRSASAEFATFYTLLHRLRLRKFMFEAERLLPFLHQDYKAGWYPFAVRDGRRRLKSLHVDVIYTSSPPYSAHFIGRTLSREYGIPWVADFRDPWTQGDLYQPGTSFQARCDRRLEAIVLESADAIIANTPTNKEAMCRDFGVTPSKVHVIPNGYDPQDFDGFGALASEGDRFVISCVGKFYEMPDTEAFFRAFTRFHKDNPTAYLRFLGPRSRRVRRDAERLLTPRSWEASERIEHTDALRIMRQSAVLLANLPLTTDVHWIPGKLYEYLAASRPILFIGPKSGDAAAIIRRAEAGLVVENHEDCILAALQTLYAEWRTAQERCADPVVVHEFDRRCQTQALGAVFESVIQKQHSPALADRIEHGLGSSGD